MKKIAKNIMIQGTCSNAGKSVITAGLCRVFWEMGYRTSPFKAQNMALNSYVTCESLEIGRAQAMQAMACRAEPDVRMNPILMKPNSDMGSQIIVMGKPIGNMTFREYKKYKYKLKKIIQDAYGSLANDYDVIIIEGAGSPAEINLKKNDIVNMYTASFTQSPVIIVGDIDRGGIFASFIGIMELLDKKEKDMVKGFIINKFRGDISLLKNGVKFIERKTEKKIYGILPYINDLGFPEEDSVAYQTRSKSLAYDKNADINIAVINLPHISNFTDLDSFSVEADVNIFSARKMDEIQYADIVIIPGSKNVFVDIKFIFEKGFDKAIKKAAQKNKMIIGICGGYQMLGNEIYDPHHIESDSEKVKGIGLMNLTTSLCKNKILKQTEAVCTINSGKVSGYEIHHGRTNVGEEPFIIDKSGEILGCINKKRNVWGTYLHGIFDNDDFRRYILNRARWAKNLQPIKKINRFNIDNNYSRFAEIIKKSLDIKSIKSIMGL